MIHGITDRPEGGPLRGSFLDAFVFPDGELRDIGFIVQTLERAGLEVRDVALTTAPVGIHQTLAVKVGEWRIQTAHARALGAWDRESRNPNIRHPAGTDHEGFERDATLHLSLI